MKIADVMTRDVELISPDATLMEAAEKMRTLDIGPLPVGTEQRVEGILTDRDIVVRAVALGRDVRSTRVREVMSAGAESVSLEDDVDDAAELMRAKQIRRVLVLDDDKKLVGIVSLGDLAVDANRKMAGKALKEISTPAEPARH